MRGRARDAGAESAAGGRRRVMIEAVRPEVDCGAFPIKRTLGERVVVEADVFGDGHDAVACALLWRAAADADWSRAPMLPLVNDRWRASFGVSALGLYTYTIEGWIDHFATWVKDLKKRVDAGQDVAVELLVGAQLAEEAAARAAAAGESSPQAAAHAAELLAFTAALRREKGEATPRIQAAFDPQLSALVGAYPDLRFATRYERELEVRVDRERARFSAWYEMFPRSAATAAGQHGTFADVEKLLPYVAELGFDILYLPPIHPIGRTFRKGRNNTLEPGPGDVGSPWAIGNEQGGHTEIHPDLGTLADFRHLEQAAREHGMELALDIAFQASPDHPWVREHPEWFKHRPDGTIRYAENPPKKYQDIYPLDFESQDWQALWQGLKGVFEFWAEQGVRVFRVDNPHTKPFPFWAWVIPELKRQWPDLIFLAEAFTRPKVMYRLAKLGFTQSYTYFAWRNHKWEIEEYFRELTRTGVVDFFRPNLWPNTPDILTEVLQQGTRSTFIARFVLAATLGASYGMYGPVYELMERAPREKGSEEYLNSEKYEVRAWDRKRPDSLAPLIARVNRVRRANPALQHNRSLQFHRVDNDRLIAYTKRSVAGVPVEAPMSPEAEAAVRDKLPAVAARSSAPGGEGDNLVLVVVNIDREYTQSGWVDLPLQELGLDPTRPYELHDMLAEAHYTWNGHWNYVELNPHVLPAHIFRIEQHR
ncbi:MAG TPA: alpha-1,4-glucan--maltose-1-phosphate maltosyltransferase [Longimicrobiales bacterium]